MARSYLRVPLIIHARIIIVWDNSRRAHRFRSIGRKLMISRRIRCAFDIYGYGGLSAAKGSSARLYLGPVWALTCSSPHHRIISPCSVIQRLGTKSLGLGARSERPPDEDRRTDGLRDRGRRGHRRLPTRRTVENPDGRATSGNQVSDAAGGYSHSDRVIFYWIIPRKLKI